MKKFIKHISNKKIIPPPQFLLPIYLVPNFGGDRYRKLIFSRSLSIERVKEKDSEISSGRPPHLRVRTREAIKDVRFMMDSFLNYPQFHSSPNGLSRKCKWITRHPEFIPCTNSVEIQTHGLGDGSDNKWMKDDDGSQCGGFGINFRAKGSDNWSLRDFSALSVAHSRRGMRTVEGCDGCSRIQTVKGRQIVRHFVSEKRIIWKDESTLIPLITSWQ